VDTSGYPELRVAVVAPPGSARPALREDGAPVTGLDVQSANVGKSVVLAVDRSESMRGAALAHAIAAARGFVDAKRAADRVEVLTFGHQAAALTGFSRSGADADAALSSLRADGVSGTALWDGVVLAARKLEHEGPACRVIILLTDGQDVSSRATFADAIAAAHRARASVYAIGIDGPDFTPAPLRTLAADTGGSYREATSSSELTAIYASIGRVLSETWELSYPTRARPGDEISLLALVPGAGSSESTVALTGIDAAPPNTPTTLLPATVWAAAWMPYAVSGAVGFLVLLACAFWGGSRKGLWVKGRLEPHLGKGKRRVKARRRHKRREVLQTLVRGTEWMFANVKQFRSLERLLERADLPLRAAELLYICAGSAIVAGLVGLIALGSPLMALAFVAGGAWAPILFVKFKASARIKAFDNQLPDLLITISASLKAGHSFRHAIQAVVDEGAEPSAKEFTRVLSEAQLGAPIDQALTDMAERVGSKNLTFVMTAVTIQRQVGGSLAGLFDMVAETVRQRQQFSRKIRGLTAMGRLSAYVLTGLPFFIGLAVTLMNPSYMAPLYHSSTGHELIVIVFAMIAVGTVVLKKIVSFRA
jgi:tight adherence protein B